MDPLNLGKSLRLKNASDKIVSHHTWMFLSGRGTTTTGLHLRCRERYMFRARERAGCHDRLFDVLMKR